MKDEEPIFKNVMKNQIVRNDKTKSNNDEVSISQNVIGNQKLKNDGTKLINDLSDDPDDNSSNDDIGIDIRISQASCVLF